MTEPTASQSEPLPKFMPERRTLPNEDQWGELYPFQPHFVRVESSRIPGAIDEYHYLDEYTGKRPLTEVPSLLFVHGNPTWSFHWRKLISAHRHEYRCLAPDHIGCGYSDLQHEPLRLSDHIENLVALLDKLNEQNEFRRVTLVAQDWGGAIGLGALLKRREMFERIVLLNTGAFKPWFIPWRIRVCRWPVFGKIALQGGNAFSRAALTMTLARKQRLDPKVAAAYLAPFDSWIRRRGVYHFVQDIPLSARHPTWHTLADIERQLPTLAGLPIQLIWGMQDWCFTPECLEKFLHYWPNAQAQRIEDAGHWVMEDASQDVAAVVARFLASTSQPSASSSSC